MPTYSATTRDASVCQDLPDHDVEAALLQALGPFGDHANKENVQLNPSIMGAPGSSPTKQPSSPLRPLSAHSLNNVKIPPPTQHAFPSGSPQKNASFYQSYQAAPSHGLPTPAYWGSFPSAQPHELKENYFDNASFVPPMAYGETDYGYKGPAKRPLDIAPLKERNVKKQKVESEDPIELPDPNDMPPVHDDGTKPIHSYAELIGMAILRAPARRLTLAQIYKWISDHFAFYKSADGGWQNSIRHNLSLNKNFIKQERPKDDPGKGNYWAIKPGEERPYLLGKKNPIRRFTNPDGSQYIQGINGGLDYRPSTAPAIGHFTLAPNPRGKIEASKAADTAKFPDEADFSSDGTIPASDPAWQEDEKDDAAAMPPPPPHMRSSPPPADIGSSPPPMMSQPRKDTPPPVPRFPSASRSRDRRQKFAGLNDSGYWSSIESSAARGAAHQLTSEADLVRPRIKRGRAEEEIRRMRSSSIDSPSKERAVSIKAPTNHFESSSPARDDNPLTPAVVFKRPAKPSPSISPNTSLLNHRERVRALLGTPAKVFSPPVPTTDWSPAFQHVEEGATGLTPFMSPYKQSKTPWRAFEGQEDSAAKGLYAANFDIFIDAPEEDMTARGSPEKRSARRPSMQRAATSSNILANITGSSKSNRLTLAPTSDSPFSLSPFINKPRLRSPAKLGSPLKQSHQPPTTATKTSPDFASWHHHLSDAASENTHPHPPSHAHPPQPSNDADDFFGVNIPSDGSEEGIDIFQDFGKIGGIAAAPQSAVMRANGSPVKRGAMGPPPPSQVGGGRPGLSRASSSRW